MGENIDEIRQIVEGYLNNCSTPEDLRRLDMWLRNDSDLGMWLKEQICGCSPVIAEGVRERIYAHLTERRSHLHDTVGQEPVTHDKGSQSIRRLKFGLLALVASVLLLIGIGAIVVLRRDDVPDNPVKVYTDAGQRSRVQLPDGSSVMLNVMSELSYRYDGDRRIRDVQLIGEAYFDVATDLRHPLVVTCGDMNVECRGTSFNVKAYADEDRVTVVLNEGTIIAHTPTESLTMKPDMLVRYDKVHGHITSSRIRSDDYCEWMNGFMGFNDDPLEDITKMLSRYHKISVNILSPELRTTRFSGSISDVCLTDALDILTIASEATYTIENDSVVYITSRPTIDSANQSL